MIPDHIKEAVRKTVLENLEAYFVEAEDYEDDNIQASEDVGARVEDFYEYRSHLGDEPGIGFTNDEEAQA